MKKKKKKIKQYFEHFEEFAKIRSMKSDLPVLSWRVLSCNVCHSVADDESGRYDEKGNVVIEILTMIATIIVMLMLI